MWQELKTVLPCSRSAHHPEKAWILDSPDTLELLPSSLLQGRGYQRWRDSVTPLLHGVALASVALNLVALLPALLRDI